MNKYKKGDVVKVRITAIEKYGAFAMIDEEYSGLIHISEITKKYVRDITDFIDDSKFSWIKINSDESIDPTWSKTGKIIKLTSSDVSSRATFICTVSI